LLKLLEDIAAVIGDALAPLVKRLVGLEKSLDGIAHPGPVIEAAVEPIVSRLAEVEARKETDPRPVIAEALAPIEGRIAAAEAKPDLAPEIAEAKRLATEGLASIEQQLAAFDVRARGFVERLAPIEARLDIVEDRRDLSQDIAEVKLALADAIMPIEARIAAVEERSIPEPVDPTPAIEKAVAPILARLDAAEEHDGIERSAIEEALCAMADRVKAVEQRPVPEPVDSALAIKEAVTPIMARIQAIEEIEIPLVDPQPAIDKAVADLLARIKAIESRTPTDGRDATQIEILHAIDLSKRHTRGTHARHRGGVIRAFRDTSPVDSSGLEAAGWDVVMNGISECEIEVDETGRNFTRRETLTDGRTIEAKWHTPAMVHRDVWAGGQYEHGDVVTWGGSQWHATKDTTAKPGDESKDWRLVVKAGRDGRDGQGPPQKRLPVIVDPTR
jgi:hypothetical protein